MHRAMPALRVTLAAAALLCAPAALAQFPITESFTGATATNWLLRGNAALTASAAGGNLDAAGSGWLRLTGAANDQAGSAIYNVAFPSTSGISITFDYADYGGTGADGFSVYLIDGATTTAQIQVGSSGGPLGYAAKYSNPTCATGPLTVTIPGVRNGYVGIGFDEWGNFSACESGVASPGLRPQSVVIRGSGTRVTAGNTQTAFRYLTGKTLASVQAGATIDGVTRAGARRVRTSIINQRISVWMDFGAGFVNVIDDHDLSTATGQIALPATFKLGISGSTGGSTNIHELRNVRVELPANLTIGQSVVPATVSVGDTVTFTITVANDATNAALGSTLTDAFPAGLADVTWSATTTTGGASVGRLSGTGDLAETVNLPKSSSVTYTVTARVTAAAAGTTLANTVTLAPPAGVANLLSNTVAANLTVNPMVSATTLAAAPAPSRFGEPVTLSAAVAALPPGSGTPGGTVTFLDGADVLGTAALDAAGTATLTTSALAVGPHALTASYGGAANFAASSSSPAAQVVEEALTETAITSTANPSVAGQLTTLSAQVTTLAPGAGVPSGLVTFFDGVLPLGTVALDGAGAASLTTSGLEAGLHALTAAYAGDGSFAASTSPGLDQLVGKVTPTVALAAGPGPSRFGQVVTLSAALAPVAPGTGVPTGTVAFLDGATVLGVAPLDASGQASLGTAALAVGPHALSVTYLGDDRFLAGGAGPVALQVDFAATTTGLLAGPSPALAGEPVVLTAAVAAVAPGAATPGGTVTFLDGTTVLGTAALDATGQATFATGTLAVGLHALSATYGGDAGHLGSGSAPADVSVVQAATTLALASSLPAPAFGDPLTLTATVAVVAPGGGTPGGTVRFFSDGLPLGDVALDGAGQAVLLIPGGALAAGAHDLTASYLGDAAYLASAAPALTLPVARATPAVALVASAAVTLTGEPVTFTATVTVPAGLPGAAGTVTFRDGATVLGAAPLDASGQATFTTAALHHGLHAVTATFEGDASYEVAASPALPHTVDPATTATALAASPSPATFGADVTLVATVTVAAPGAGTPTGLVTFLDGGVALGAASVDASGRATLIGSGLGAGAHVLTARYAGDGAFRASTSPATALAIEAAPTALVLATSGSPTALGEPVTLTATVTSAAGTPVGTVLFRDGATLIGSATLSGGRASLALPALALGSHPLTAAYAGTADFAASSGAVTQVVVQAAADVALSAAPSPAVAGQPVQLTVLVTARPPGAGTPTGVVRLLDGATLLGTATLSGGVATLLTGALPVGVHSLTAEYEGDAAFLAGATTSPVLLAVDPAATATTLAATAPASVFTEPVTFTATVAVVAPGAGVPTGTVTFTAGPDTLGTAAVEADGTAALTLPALPVGGHDVVATHGGDPSFALSVSAPLHHDVAAASVAVLVTAAPPLSAVGQPVTFTVTVTPVAPALGPVAGSVTLRDGATVLGTAALDASGRATFTTGALAIGPHLLAADFTGAGPGFAPAASPDLAFEVFPAGTTTLVQASPSPAVFGEAVTLTAAVARTDADPAPVTGTVDFTLDGAAVGSAPVAGGQATLVLPAGAVHAGQHAAVATYLGAPGLAGSTSPAAALEVAPAPVLLAAEASPAAPVAGQPVVLRAVATSSGGVPAGAAVFTVDGLVLPAVPLDAAGVALLPAGAFGPGPHAFGVSLPASADFGPATATGTFEVRAAASTTSLVADRAASTWGEAVAFTATVLPVAPGAALPAGDVTFLDGATLLGTAVLLPSGGGAVATFTTAALTPGPHAVTAVFAGTAELDGSTSAPAAVTVAPAAVTLALAAAPSPSVVGQAVTLTADVSVATPGAGRPAGPVTFRDGATLLGTAAPDGAGRAVLTTAALPVGPHTLTAHVDAEARFLAADATALHEVGPAASSVALVALPSAAVAGQPVTLTATIAATAPGAAPAAGEVTFLDGATVLGTAPIAPSAAGGTATLTLATLPVGAHPITAAFGGTADLAASSSAPADVAVSPAATALVLLADPTPSTFGEPVQLTAQVTVAAPGAGVPAGDVTFFDGADVLGTATLDGSGVARLTTAALPAGARILSASVAAAGPLLGSTGTALHTVDPAATALALAAAPSPSAAGQAVTLTASVTVTAPGAGTPAGEVTFLDGADVLGTAALDAAGQARLTTSALAVGPHALAATWPGGPGLLPASGTAAHEVGRSASATAVVADRAAVTFGEPVAFTATVTAAGGGAGAPTGLVTFRDGATVLGTAPVDGSGRATLTASLAAGSHAVTAEYGGDDAFATSSGAAPAAVEVARAASQVALEASPSSVTAGDQVTLTATVGSAAGTPGGTVTFRDGDTVLGTAPVGPGGVATLVVTLGPGDHALSADASGDADHLPASGAATVTVTRPASAVTVTSSRNPSRANQPVGLLAAVAPGAGGTATGSVEFWDDSGAAPVLLGSVPLTDGEAFLAVRDLVKGTHPIRVEYLGSDLLAPATGTLPGDQVVLNTTPVAGSGTALALGGAPSAAAAATAPLAITLDGTPLDAAQGTVELWARAGWTDASQVGPAPTLATLSGPGGLRWRLGVSPDRRAVEVAVGTATASVPAALDDGGWHHLALVGEAAGTTLLVDGVEAGALAEPFGPAAAHALVLGEGFVGELDELRTWSVVRTPADLAAGARQPMGGREPGLTGLWRFDEGSGLELFDSGPNGLDAAVTLVDPAATPAAFAPSAAWRDRQVASSAAMAPAAAGYDADEDALVLTVTRLPAHGTATADQDALAVGYTSDAGFGGADTLTFALSDGEATDDFTLAIAVTAPAACTESAQCGGGNVCLQGACVPEHRLDVRAGGCGCGNAGGGAVALWSILSLALLRRRRPARPAEGRAP